MTLPWSRTATWTVEPTGEKVGLSVWKQRPSGLVLGGQTGSFSWFYWDGTADLSASSDRLIGWTEKQQV